MRRVNNKNYNLSFAVIVVNIIVFIMSMFIQTDKGVPLNSYLQLHPVLFSDYGFYWTPFTYMFAHSGLSHLFFNMFALFMFGHSVETRLGSIKFILFYILSGIFAGAFSLILYSTLNIGVRLIGASGAIYAVLFAFAVLYPNRKIYIFGIIPLNPPTLIIIYTGYDIFSHVFRSTNVAHITHLSGFLFAYLYFKIYLKVDPIYIFKNYKRFRD